MGQFQVISVLLIGYTQLHVQAVFSHPFPHKTYRSRNRQDLVFVRPPDAGKVFCLSINTVWYLPVLLLFSFHASTDSGIKRYDCAFVSLLCEYDAKLHGAQLF